MKLVRRCAFCGGIWVNWNIKLEMTEEPVYAHDYRECGRIHLTDHWIHGGMPCLLLAITHKVQLLRPSHLVSAPDERKTMHRDKSRIGRSSATVLRR